MIRFNVPPFTGRELEYIKEAIDVHKICGDGQFTKKCSAWIEEKTGTAKALLTTSCTHATEMAALLADIQPGDEVIMPAYTFVSTADAFVLRGATVVFVDIRPDTMNIDETKIEAAITAKTKAIVPVHYAGVACEMDTILDIAERHHLIVIEDAAQGMMATYKGKALGTIGDYGCYSFHETKNYSMGEVGCILIKDSAAIEEAEIIREKGTNRSKFFRGQIDKYTWVDKGSSYLPSDMNAAYLWAQLELADKINSDRMHSWQMYEQQLAANKAQLESDYNQNVSGLDSEASKIGSNYYEQRRQTQANADRSQASYNEMANASGLNSGTGGQAALSRSNQLQSDLTALGNAEAQNRAEIERQRTLLGQQYQNAIQKAQAENNMELAQRLYQEAVRVDESIIDASRNDSNRALEILNMMLNQVSSDRNLASEEARKAAEIAAAGGKYGLYGKLYGLSDDVIAQLETIYNKELADTELGRRLDLALKLKEIGKNSSSRTDGNGYSVTDILNGAYR